MEEVEISHNCQNLSFKVKIDVLEKGIITTFSLALERVLNLTNSLVRFNIGIGKKLKH